MNAATEEVVMSQPALAQPTRPFYWLVRREIWESRSFLIVPLVTCGICAFFYVLALFGWGNADINGRPVGDQLAILPTLGEGLQRLVLAFLFGSLAFLVNLSMVVVAVFYMLDALHAERRDRSILFWKSLPVSDTETVLSKLFVGTVGIMAIGFVATIGTHLFLTVVTSLYMLAHGYSAGLAWSSVPMIEGPGAYLYTIVVYLLWCAPLHGWFLLVSAWAKRAALLWAVLPPALIALCEYLAFGTRHFLSMVGDRVAFTATHAYRKPEDVLVLPNKEIVPRNFFDTLDPAGFFSNPYLWTGLVVAAAFVVGAIWLRRYREPL